MCGRARCTLRADDFRRACHINTRPVRHLNMDWFRPSYNVAPGFNVPVVRRDEDGSTDGVVLHCMKWGLVPSFTKKSEKPDHFRMFNARSESIREKASFRRLLPKNRCLVSVEGFYEWKKDGSRKQPYYIHFKDGRPLVFAALFDYWKNSEGEILYTFTIITTSSSSSLEWLHDRMPVVLGNKESMDYWMNDSSSSNIEKVLKPYEHTDLVWYPVTTAIGKLSFDGPECIKEIQVKTAETKSISQFFSRKAHAPSPQAKLELTPTKEDLPRVVKDEFESQSMIQNTRINNEDDTSVKEEPEGQVEDKGDDTSAGTFNKTEKRGYAAEFMPANNKPLAKEEAEKQHAGPVGKRSKSSDDKQPTLFSYFGQRSGVTVSSLAASPTSPPRPSVELQLPPKKEKEE